MKQIISFLILVAAASCIDPYYPNLKNFTSLLVVEGLITNENNSYQIKLSRTTGKEDSIPETVTDANVYIIDGVGVKTHLINSGDGYYKTDSTSFTGVVGQKYTLQILTSDGKEYRSEKCTMLPVAGIDKVFFEKGEEISGNQGGTQTGLKILLNSTDAAGMNKYFRWTYEEAWKYILPSPKRYIYINDSTFIKLPVVTEYCWKKTRSEEIIASSILSGETSDINRHLIKFIAPANSDRLTLQYSILVKQYSISEKEYDFWNNLKKVSVAGGDIFDSQPYPVISNVHNVNDAGEMVLGYFEVSAISQKRIFITAHELIALGLPQYKSDCIEYAKSPSDYNTGPNVPPATWQEIYDSYIHAGGFTFVGPLLNEYGTRLKLIFAPNACAVCEASGVSAKPDFWVDM